MSSCFPVDGRSVRGHGSRILATAVFAVALSLMSGCGGPTPTKPTPVEPPAPIQPPAPEPEPEPVPGPFLTCPADVQVNSRDGQAVVVNYDVPAASEGNPPVEVSCTPLPGTAFPPGSTQVACTASDSKGQSAVCRFTVRVIPPPRLTLTRFLAFGDSITEGKTALTSTILGLMLPDAYSMKLELALAARYTTQKPIVINDSVGGEKVVGVSPHSPGGDVRLPGSLDTHRPEVLLLMEGSNDIGESREAGFIAIAGLEKMIRMAKSRGVLVFLATIPPIRPGGLRNRPAAAWVPEFNDNIRALAVRENVPLVDVHAAMKDRLDLIGLDDLHLTAQGYDVMAQVFFDAIKARLEVQPSAALTP